MASYLLFIINSDILPGKSKLFFIWNKLISTILFLTIFYLNFFLAS